VNLDGADWLRSGMEPIAGLGDVPPGSGTPAQEEPPEPELPVAPDVSEVPPGEPIGGTAASRGVVCAPIPRTTLLVATTAAGVVGALALPFFYQCEPVGRCRGMLWAVALAPAAVLGLALLGQPEACRSVQA
jgi:hypothetical protein